MLTSLFISNILLFLSYIFALKVSFIYFICFIPFFYHISQKCIRLKPTNNFCVTFFSLVYIFIVYSYILLLYQYIDYFYLKYIIYLFLFLLYLIFFSSCFTHPLKKSHFNFMQKSPNFYNNLDIVTNRVSSSQVIVTSKKFLHKNHILGCQPMSCTRDKLD